jgi:hypothetical protein
MKTLHTLKIEIWKTVGNFGFLISILITFALLFTVEVYTDSLTGKAYNVMEAFLLLDEEIIKIEPVFASTQILKNTFSSYFIMFIPIIAAFPFIPNFCAERNGGLLRFAIQRTGKFRYYIAKFLSSILGGGLCVLFGYLLFSLVVTIAFPSIADYELSKEVADFYSESNTIIHILLSTIGIFLYGCFSTVPAFVLASFVKNRYIITCVPFMITYLYSSSLTKLIYDGIETQNQRWVDIGTTLKPEAVSRLYLQDTMSRNSLLIYAAFAVACFFLFVLIMNRRCDFGE